MGRRAQKTQRGKQESNSKVLAKFSGFSKNCIHIRGKIFPLKFNYLNLNLAESINCNWPGRQTLKLSLKFSNRLYPQIFFLQSSKPHFAIAGFQLQLHQTNICRKS